MSKRTLKPLTHVGEFTLPPDGAGAARAFSRIGYELEHALADLIDNSIDATRRRVSGSIPCSPTAAGALDPPTLMPS